MTIHPLSEGSFTIGHEKIFERFDQQTDELTKRAQGSLLVEVQPFLVKTANDLILLDCGLGFELAGVLQLHQNIVAAGFQPEEVTKVLMSHLHKDHAGGVAHLNGFGQQALSLPNATYYVQEAELEAAMNNVSKSYIPEDIAMLHLNRQVELLRGDGIIDGYIQYALSGGHSPFHQVFWIRENGQTIFFGGDEAPQLGQLRKKYVAKYDHDGRRAMELRQQWWAQGQEEGWTFLFYHDIKGAVWPKEIE